MPRSRNNAFTLVEMLVVIGLIGVLVGLVVPVMANIRAESRSTQCLSNLRQLFGLTEAARQQNQDMLPYAAPLPLPEGQIAIVPSLPERLKAMIPPRSDVWFCPGDATQDSQEIGTSYMYVPGAFMLAEPPLAPQSPTGGFLTPHAEAQRVARVITQRYTTGYLRYLPVLADSEKYHRAGHREPWNVVMIDGNARPAKRNDGDVAPTDTNNQHQH